MKKKYRLAKNYPNQFLTAGQGIIFYHEKNDLGVTNIDVELDLQEYPYIQRLYEQGLIVEVGEAEEPKDFQEEKTKKILNEIPETTIKEKKGKKNDEELTETLKKLESE